MASAVDDTRFSIYAVPAEGVSLEQLEEAVDEALRALPSLALESAVVERVKNRLVAETIYAADSQSSLARIYGSALAIGETLADVSRWPSQIEAVQSSDLASVAERFLVPRRSVTGQLRKAG
jgi:zinc protease